MSGCVLSVFAVVPRRIGGVETFARELSSQLRQRQWDSALTFLAPPTEAVRRFLEMSNTSIEVLADCINPALGDIRKVSELIKKHQPDILHVYFTGFLTLYPWLGRALGVRQIYLTDQTSRPEGHITIRAPFLKRVVGRIANYPLTRAIGISDYNAQCCVERGYVSSDRVSRVYNGVDAGRGCGDVMSLRRQFAISERRAIVVQVSSIAPEKGIPDLLETARLTLASKDEVQFVIVGDGPYKQEYVGLAGSLGLGDHVTWAGLVADPVTQGVYSGADIVCQLSRWQEGFGWVIAEAMMCGRPVIGTRVGAIPEVIEDGRSGFLVAPRNPADAADRILQLLDDPQLRLRMGRDGASIAKRRFDLSRNVAELLKLYGLPSPESDPNTSSSI